MLTIRLQRGGRTNRAHFRLVLTQKTRANQKKAHEILGSYNPHSKELIVRDQDRLNYWIKEQHVSLSKTAHNLLIEKGLLEGTKVRAFSIPPKPPTEEEAKPEAAAQSSEEQESTEAPTEESTPEEKTEEPAQEPQAEEAKPESDSE
ncbi:MAG: 30S ribosomal protein S16 [Candidatus Doudnabacteria bacterium]